MKIALTPTEFRRLLHLIYIGTWILDAHRTAHDPRTVPYNKLEQKLLAIAHSHGFHDLVEYAPGLISIFPHAPWKKGRRTNSSTNTTTTPSGTSSSTTSPNATLSTTSAALTPISTSLLKNASPTSSTTKSAMPANSINTALTASPFRLFHLSKTI